MVILPKRYSYATQVDEKAPNGASPGTPARSAAEAHRVTTRQGSSAVGMLTGAGVPVGSSPCKRGRTSSQVRQGHLAMIREPRRAAVRKRLCVATECSCGLLLPHKGTFPRTCYKGAFTYAPPIRCNPDPYARHRKPCPPVFFTAKNALFSTKGAVPSAPRPFHPFHLAHTLHINYLHIFLAFHSDASARPVANTPAHTFSPTLRPSCRQEAPLPSLCIHSSTDSCMLAHLDPGKQGRSSVRSTPNTPPPANPPLLRSSASTPRAHHLYCHLTASTVATHAHRPI